ncbi:MAG: hypothetical protein M0Z55_03855 [Peptococcaceae bacterium]|nr:hypothetical protein [Peptococcaceae bacterium]
MNPNPKIEKMKTQANEQKQEQAHTTEEQALLELAGISLVGFLHLKRDNENLEQQVACHKKMEEYYKEMIATYKLIKKLQDSMLTAYREWEKELPAHLRLARGEEQKQAA